MLDKSMNHQAYPVKAGAGHKKAGADHKNSAGGANSANCASNTGCTVSLGLKIKKTYSTSPAYLRKTTDLDSLFCTCKQIWLSLNVAKLGVFLFI